MSTTSGSDAPTIPRPPQIEPELTAVLRAHVPALAEATLRAIDASVPGYAGLLAGPSRQQLEDGVRMVYEGFLGVLSDGDPDGATLDRVRRGAYALGRGEARAGRSIDLLLSAYRVGSRVHWQELARTAVEHDLDVTQVTELAALVFAYGDELSAASVAGHADQTAASARDRDVQRERLTRALLAGDVPLETLTRRAGRAGWAVPVTLTAVVLPSVRASTVARAFAGTLSLPLDESDELTALLVPDAHDERPRLLALLRGRDAVVGPARAWHEAARSYRRAVRAASTLPPPADGSAIDTQDHLSLLLVHADPDLLDDLRRQVLEPLADLPADTAARLALTLRSWLLHLGRRDAVAADLHVHPQTVRYRMAQVRDRYGPWLNDPERVLALVLGLPSA